MHNTMWNSLCGGWDVNDKTPGAHRTCDDLSSFVENGWERYRGCGYNCRTQADADGRWGWNHLRPDPTFDTVPGEPAVTHLKTCYFHLGALKIGYCPRD
jgi:hypothetical protein